MSRRTLALVTVGFMVACADPGLEDSAPTRMRDVEVDGGYVRVAPLQDAIAVAWQDGMTGTTTAALLDASLQESWRITFGAGLPVRLRVRQEQIHVLAAGELFVLSPGGEMIAQWPVPNAVDFALTSEHLVVLENDRVLELDDAGNEVSMLPVDPALTDPWALEASEAGYCPTGYHDESDNTTTCFGWDGAVSPVRIAQPSTVASAEREFVSLSDDGVVAALSQGKLFAQQLADGGYLGEYAPDRGDAVKTFVGPGGRTMWLGLEDWCGDNCYQGFYVGLLDGARSEATWVTDLFEVMGFGGDIWSAQVDDDRVIVATDRHVYVLDAEP